MGYVLKKNRELQAIANIENYIKNKWQWIYQFDINKAYPRRGVSVFHRHLLYLTKIGVISKFYTIGKQTKISIKIEHTYKPDEEYSYYADFLAYTVFGMVYFEISVKPLPLSFLYKIKKTGKSIRFIDKKFLRELTKIYPELRNKQFVFVLAF